MMHPTARASCERTAVMALAGLALAGCAVHYSGAGRATTKAALDAEPGWVMTEVPDLRQHELSDCGPTALAILGAHWGLEPERTRTSVHRAKDDATFAELRVAARSLGLTAFVISADQETLMHELELGRPVVIGLMRPYGKKYVRGHYEVVAGIHPTRRLVATVDPAGGWRVRSFEQLDAEWAPTEHAAMVVTGVDGEHENTTSARVRAGARQNSTTAPRTSVIPRVTARHEGCKPTSSC